MNDLRFAFRQLHRRPGFAFAVILTLALAVGVNTASSASSTAFCCGACLSHPERIAALVTHKEGVDPRSNRVAAERTTVLTALLAALEG